MSDVAMRVGAQAATGGRQRRLALATMVGSGFAALGEQIVWTQQSGLWLGHDAAAVLAVVAAFFGGLAVGALGLGARIARSSRPAAWYAVCELVIGGWAAVLLVLLPAASGTLQGWIGARPTPLWQWAVAFGGSFALLLPATAAMGATLPAMERIVSDLQQRAGASLAALYAANTFGAVLGVLGTALWLVPAWGLSRTGAVCIGLNVACAMAAWSLRGGDTAVDASGGAPGGPRRVARVGPALQTSLRPEGSSVERAGAASLVGSGGAAAAVSGERTRQTAAVAQVEQSRVASPGSLRSAPVDSFGVRPSASPASGLLPLLAATGALGIGYEVLVVRVLSQVAENTVYTFALLLAVYLVGSALGAAAWSRAGGWAAAGSWAGGPPAASSPAAGSPAAGWAAIGSPSAGSAATGSPAAGSAAKDSPAAGSPAGGSAATDSRAAGVDPDATPSRDSLLTLLAAACLVGTASLWGAPGLKAAVGTALGPGMGAALAGEAAIAVAAFLLPSAAMGAVFSHLAVSARAHGIGLGRSLGVNTLGAAVAPLVFGVLLLPAIGPKFALLTIAAGYLAWVSWRRWTSWPVLAVGAALVGLALLAPPLAFVDVPAGGQVLSYRDGAMAAVSVVEDADGIDRLRIDNRQQEGDSASRPADARQALLPLLLHPAPRRALFLGLGTGVTAASAAEDPGLQVDAVELLPEVIAASKWFTRGFGDGGGPSRLQPIAADARRYVRTVDTRYDIVVADNFHPARSGSGSLYTVEHFQAVRARLADGGVFCQWLPLHQLDLATLAQIVRTFMTVYPDGVALLATNSLETPVLGLVGRAGGTRFDADRVLARVAQAAPTLQAPAFGLDSVYAVLGSVVAGPRSLAAFGASAALNTDDRPVVAYQAPRVTYAPESRPRDRLIELLRLLQVDPGEVDDASSGSAVPARLAAYREARDRFLVVGRDVQPTGDVRKMLAQIGEPLLEVLRKSPDFRPAYDPLLRMASALASRDPAAARRWLEALARLQPDRPEAREALERIEGTMPR